MEWNVFFQWLFFGVFSLIGVIMAFIANHAINTLDAMKQSIDSLTQNVSVLLERTATHERRIERLETKVDNQ